MFRKIVAAGLLIALGMVGTVNAQMPDPPKVVSSSDSKTAGKKTVFQVKPGEKITFSVKAKGAEKYQWLVNKAIRKGAEADSFTWTVPDKKGMWKILLKTTSKARQKWGREKAASCDKWLSAQEHGKKFPKEKNRFVRDIADIYTWPVQSETEWIVATFLTTVKPGESIQKAIDSLPPEGGIVELAAGTHEITDSISIKRSDVTIAGTHDSIIRHHNKNLACFSLRGRKSAVKNITFTGFAMASTYTRADRARNAMISAATVTNFTVANMRDTSWARVFVGSGGGKGWGFTDPSMDVTIKNNIAEHCGLGASKTGNLRILNNTILGSPHCNAIATDHALRYLYIVGNRVINAGVNAGILVDKPVHCLVSNNFVRSRQKGIRSNNSGRQTIIENNTLTGASYAGIWITCQPKMPESLIRNNLIYNNRDGVYTSSEFRGRQQYTHIRLTNNVICNNKRDGIRTGAEEVSMIVSNNIIANNGGYGINYKVKGPLTLSHNNLWNNGQGNYNGIAAGPGDFSKEPLFAAPSKHDYHLKSKAGRWDPKAKKWVKDKVQSPCIDAGDPKADYSKEPAPNGGRVNVGAYGNTEEASKSVEGKKIEVKQKALSINIKKGQLSIGTLSVHEPPNNLTNQIGQPVQFPNGDILIAWEYGAKSEYSSRGKIAGSISKDGGKTWGKVFIFQDIPKIRDCQPRFLVVDNRIHFFFATSGVCYSKTSTDNGATWSEPKIICRGNPEQPILTSKSHIVLPLYGGGVFCSVSTDRGKTWRRGGNIEGGMHEPAIVELGDGRLYCLMRMDPGGCQYESYSADGGMTWTKAAPSKVKSPRAPARLLKLKSGHILLVWNNVSSKGHLPRHPLVAAISTDDCKSWKYMKTIRDKGDTPQTKAIKGRQDFSNFGMCQITGGMVIVAMEHYYYTKIDGRRIGVADLDLAVFDEEWLRK